MTVTIRKLNFGINLFTQFSPFMDTSLTVVTNLPLAAHNERRLQTNSAPPTMRRGISENSSNPRHSFAKAESAPRLHPHSELRGYSANENEKSPRYVPNNSVYRAESQNEYGAFVV